jgi:hypothetical protein
VRWLTPYGNVTGDGTLPLINTMVNLKGSWGSWRPIGTTESRTAVGSPRTSSRYY